MLFKDELFIIYYLKLSPIIKCSSVILSSHFQFYFHLDMGYHPPLLYKLVDRSNQTPNALRGESSFSLLSTRKSSRETIQQYNPLSATLHCQIISLHQHESPQILIIHTHLIYHIPKDRGGSGWDLKISKNIFKFNEKY
jgi:hypothetical protein